MRTAKQLIETFDTIGNRTQTQAGGDQNGANLRVANYTNNTLNQITSRGVPGYVDVVETPWRPTASRSTARRRTGRTNTTGSS